MVSQKFIEEQPQILRLTTPRLKSTPGAPFAQDDSKYCAARLKSTPGAPFAQDYSKYCAARLKSTPEAPFAQDDSNLYAAYFRMTAIFVLHISDSGH